MSVEIEETRAVFWDGDREGRRARRSVQEPGLSGFGYERDIWMVNSYIGTVCFLGLYG